MAAGALLGVEKSPAGILGCLFVQSVTSSLACSPTHKWKVTWGRAAFWRQLWWSLESISRAAPQPCSGKHGYKQCCSFWVWPMQGAVDGIHANRVTVIWKILSINELENSEEQWQARNVALSGTVTDWLAFQFCQDIDTWSIAHRSADNNLTSETFPHQSNLHCTKHKMQLS